MAKEKRQHEQLLKGNKKINQEIKLIIKSKPTEAPQSLALAISGLAATSITATLAGKKRGIKDAEQIREGGEECAIKYNCN